MKINLMNYLKHNSNPLINRSIKSNKKEWSNNKKEINSFKKELISNKKI